MFMVLQCQEQLATTTAVAEDARAKLGTLTQVKEFLVEKLKESEVAIRQAHEARDAVKEQVTAKPWQNKRVVPGPFCTQPR